MKPPARGRAAIGERNTVHVQVDVNVHRVSAYARALVANLRDKDWVRRRSKHKSSAIERYRREAEERFRRLDALLERMDDDDRDQPKEQGAAS